MWVWFDTGDLAGLAGRVAGLGSAVRDDDASVSVLGLLWHRLDALSLVEVPFRVPAAEVRAWVVTLRLVGVRSRVDGFSALADDLEHLVSEG